MGLWLSVEALLIAWTWVSSEGECIRIRRHNLRKMAVILAITTLAVTAMCYFVLELPSVFCFLWLPALLPDIGAFFWKKDEGKYEIVLEIINKNLLAGKVRPKKLIDDVIELLWQSGIISLLQFSNNNYTDRKLAEAVKSAEREVKEKYAMASEFYAAVRNSKEFEKLKYAMIGGPVFDQYIFDGEQKYPFTSIDIIVEKSDLLKFHKGLTELGYVQIFTANDIAYLSGRTYVYNEPKYMCIETEDTGYPWGGFDGTTFYVSYQGINKIPVRICTEITGGSTRFSEEAMYGRSTGERINFTIVSPGNAAVLLMLAVYEDLETEEANLSKQGLNIKNLVSLKYMLDTYKKADFWKDVEEKLISNGFQKQAGTVLQAISSFYGKKFKPQYFSKISWSDCKSEKNASERWQNPEVSAEKVRKEIYRSWKQSGNAKLYTVRQAESKAETKSDFVEVQAGVEFRLSYRKIVTYESAGGAESEVCAEIRENDEAIKRLVAEAEALREPEEPQVEETMILEWRFTGAEECCTEKNLYELRFYPLVCYTDYIVWKIQTGFKDDAFETYGIPSRSVAVDTYKEKTDRQYRTEKITDGNIVSLKIEVPFEEFGIEDNMILGNFGVRARTFKQYAGNVYYAENSTGKFLI